MDSDGLIPRIGTFFVIVGVGLIALFAISDFAGMTNFDYFFLGMFVIGLGVLFRRRAAPPPPSGRFSILRKLREMMSPKSAKK
ncbi:MAG: hypothetical protein D6770_05245 [Anaerolineae bacterium]|nr:MAG: hypothetical protein D6770_05245 [Anaerolineae bacterium]